MSIQETYNTILAQADYLPAEEIRHLINDLNAKLEQLNRQQTEPKQRHKAREFRGVGRETWKNIDVEEYIRQERASWDA